MRTIMIAVLSAALSLTAAASAQAKGMKLTSQDMKAGGTIKMEQVFNGFGCTGGNKSPQLSWSGVPAKAKSLVLTVYDPDAPTGSGWWHWVVFNIPAGTRSLPTNAGDPKAGLMPAGAVQSRTDFGAPGWGGPCPPQGDKPHRYVFTIHAIDLESLQANADSSAALIGFYLHFHTIAKASLTARFGRK